MKTNATLATLAFFAKYNTRWHSYNKKHHATAKAVISLSKRGFLEVDFELGMARFTGKVFQ